MPTKVISTQMSLNERAAIAYGIGVEDARKEQATGATEPREYSIDDVRLRPNWVEGYVKHWDDYKAVAVLEAPYHAIDQSMERALTELLVMTKSLGGSPVGLVVAALKNVGEPVEDWDRGWFILTD